MRISYFPEQTLKKKKKVENCQVITRKVRDLRKSTGHQEPALPNISSELTNATQ